MKELLNSIGPIIGETGLFALIVFAIATLVVLRPYVKLKYSILVYVICSGALWNAVYVPLFLPPRLLETNVMFLITGLSAWGAYKYAKWRSTGLMLPKAGKIADHIILFGGIGASIAVVLIVLCINSMQTKRIAETNRQAFVKDSVERLDRYRNTMNAILADTALTAELKRKLDSKEDELKEARKQTANAKKEREREIERSKTLEVKNKRQAQTIDRMQTRNDIRTPEKAKNIDTVRNEKPKKNGGFLNHRNWFGLAPADSSTKRPEELARTYPDR